MSRIELRSISKAYAGKPVLQGVSLQFPEHALSALLGPSGCGKTTLLRIIAGLEQADAGQVLIEGRDIAGVPVQERGVGLVFQNYALWPHMSVAENVAFGLRVQRLPRAQLDSRVQEALESVQLLDFALARPQQLSGGQQQRVALARVLALKPRVILLDEPLSNLDSRLREEVREQLLRLQRQTQVTMLMVTHDREEALSSATHVALLMGGAVAQEGSPRLLYERPASPAVANFLGDANIWSAHVAEPGAEATRLMLADGVTLQMRGGEHPVGAELKVLLRPENIQIADRADTAPGGASLGAQIEELRYQGALSCARCRILRPGFAVQTAKPGCDLSELWVQVIGTSAGLVGARVGDRVQLWYQPQQVHAFG